MAIPFSNTRNNGLNTEPSTTAETSFAGPNQPTGFKAPGDPILSQWSIEDKKIRESKGSKSCDINEKMYFFCRSRPSVGIVDTLLCTLPAEFIYDVNKDGRFDDIRQILDFNEILCIVWKPGNRWAVVAKERDNDGNRIDVSDLLSRLPSDYQRSTSTHSGAVRRSSVKGGRHGR